jgi:integrase
MNNLTLTNNKGGLPLTLTNQADYIPCLKHYNTFLDDNGYSINEDSVKAFFASIKDSYSFSHQNKHKAAIKAAIKRGYQISGIDNSRNLIEIERVFNEIKIPRQNYHITSRKYITDQEINSIISKAGVKTGLLIMALRQTGCRVSELVNIKLDKCFKTSKGIEIEIVRLKANRVNHVYMQPELFAEIKKAYNGKIYLFESHRKPGYPITRIAAYTLIKNAGCYIEKDTVHPHTLRHSFAIANMEKLGLPKTSNLLGHSSTKITAEYYLSDAATEKEIFDAMPKYNNKGV